MTVVRKSLKGQYAGFVSRLLAFIIDLLLISISIVILGSISALLLQFFGLSELLSEAFVSNSTLGYVLRILAYLGSFHFVFIVYQTFMLVTTAGKTIGMAVMGIRIVPLDGSRLKLVRTLVRYAAFWLSILALGLGVLWILGDDRRMSWHDKIARTCVIYDWDAREDERFLKGLTRRLRHLRDTRTRVFSRRKPAAATLPPGPTEAP